MKWTILIIAAIPERFDDIEKVFMGIAQYKFVYRDDKTEMMTICVSKELPETVKLEIHQLTACKVMAMQTLNSTENTIFAGITKFISNIKN